MSETSNEEEIVIRVRGLPWTATKADINDFFEGVTFLNGEKGIHMTLSREGRPSGEAYIELESAEHINLALKKHNAHMGPRYIEVFEAKRSEMEWVIKRANFSPGQEDDCCVRLRGVPFGCSKEEIMHFFSGLEIVPNGIALPTDYQGKHTGEAYVQFVNKETTQKAMEKHKEKIAHRYIEIFNSNLSEINSAMTPKMRGSGSMGGFNRPSPYSTRDRYGGSNKYGSGGRGRGGRSFNQRFEFEDSAGWGNSSDSSWLDGGSRGMGQKSFRDRMDNKGWPSDGHYVHMRGLPFRATERDIADFFRPLNPLNITIQVDNLNRPSGEADVELTCHDEALEAMTKDKGKMQHRYIELFLNSTAALPLMGSSFSMNQGGGGGGNFGGSMGGGNNYGGFNSGMGRMGGGSGGSYMGRRFNDNMNGGGNNMQSNFRRGGGGGSYNNYSGPNQMGGSNYNSFC